MRRNERANRFLAVLNQTIDSAIELANAGGARKRNYRISAEDIGVTRVTANLQQDIVKICRDLNVPVECGRGVWFALIDVDRASMTAAQAGRLKGAA